jgi:hypothetical protein
MFWCSGQYPRRIELVVVSLGMNTAHTRALKPSRRPSLDLHIHIISRTHHLDQEREIPEDVGVDAR